MKTHRLYTPERLSVGAEIRLEGKAAHYLSRVLRLTRDDELILFNGDGYDYRGKLADFRRDFVVVQVSECMANDTASSLRITLAQAMSRGDRMDYTLQKATELGVWAVQLLESERVELKLSGARLEKRLEHWQGVIRAACEQSGRATMPELIPPVSLAGWTEGPGVKVVLDAGGEHSLGDLKHGDEISIAVGPEGGFSEPELELMGRRDVLAVRMGPRILRTETAGPAAIAVLQSLAGDL